MPLAQLFNVNDLIAHVKAVSVGPLDDDEPVIFGGVTSKRFDLKAGMVLVSHRHVYDHMSILAVGEAMLRTPEGDMALVGPAVVKIKAGIEHALETITDVTWFCLHREGMELHEQEHNPHSTDGMIFVRETK